MWHAARQLPAWLIFDVGQNMNPPPALLYSLGKDLTQAVFRAFKGKPTADVLRHRQRIKSEIQERFSVSAQVPLENAVEVLIRDVDRIHQYPEAKVQEEEGKASPFFKTELRGLYHSGIEVYLRVVELWEDPGCGAWALAKAGEDYSSTAFLIGRIPFDWIQHIDPAGDEYDFTPHIFCRFSKRGAPYEEIRVRKIYRTGRQILRTEDLGSLDVLK
jgi:hypothetical protein